jgi:hypothetical protein
VLVPPVPERLWVEVDDGLDGGRNGDDSISLSPHSLGGGDAGAETIGRRGRCPATAEENLEDGEKSRGCGAARLRRVEMDGLEVGRAVVLAFVELEVDGVVKRDRGEGGAGVFFCDDVVWVWVLKESDEFLPVLRVLCIRSLSSSEDGTLAVVTDAVVWECHVSWRRRGRDDCCVEGRERAVDFTEPVDALLGGNAGEDGDGVNPALEPEGEDENRGDMITLRCLVLVAVLGRRFGLRSVARSASSASRFIV